MTTMSRIPIRLALPATALLASALVAVPPTAAAPSCVAQSVASEHQLYGTAWGHDLVAFLASHPEVLREFGFRSFGELASYAATLDHDACPADL
jgi:hypothetical protein